MFKGKNRLAVGFEKGESQSLTLSAVELEVRYKK
jgi:hypothetical protein